ncbi:hypothetical protein HMPREF0476_0361 [Kingella kingae ATCC 23330]|uniref:Uncharacterized protein n=1 Tax=Kingella kingae ATCC 23330 TaxID=887327 RepID=F5S578_KINKI|nr:hypothetical protein HMPREF0476_0361 [Kingella kingae ATCC 23330]
MMILFLLMILALIAASVGYFKAACTLSVAEKMANRFCRFAKLAQKSRFNTPINPRYFQSCNGAKSAFAAPIANVARHLVCCVAGYGGMADCAQCGRIKHQHKKERE